MVVFVAMLSATFSCSMARMEVVVFETTVAASSRATLILSLVTAAVFLMVVVFVALVVFFGVAFSEIFRLGVVVVLVS